MNSRLKELFISIYVDRAVKQKELYNSPEEKQEITQLVDEYSINKLGHSIFTPQSEKTFEDIYMDVLAEIFKEIKQEKLNQN